MARPPRVMKLRVMSCQVISRMPESTLSGMERAMTMVGLRVDSRPRTTVGRRVSMKMNTTATANRKTEQGLPEQSVNLGLYLRALVGDNHKIDAGLYALQAIQDFAYRLSHLDGVGLGVLYDGNADGWLAVGAGNAGGRSVGERLRRPHPTV